MILLFLYIVNYWGQLLSLFLVIAYKSGTSIALKIKIVWSVNGSKNKVLCYPISQIAQGLVIKIKNIKVTLWHTKHFLNLFKKFVRCKNT